MSIQARITALAQAVAADIKSLVSGKAPTVHAHTVDDIPGLGPILDAASQPTAWADIQNRPANYPPSAHAHRAEDITSGQVNINYLPFGARQIAIWGSSHDPDTTIEPVFVSNTGAVPAVGYWYIVQFFYSSVSVNTNRCQIAITYTGVNTAAYVRHFFGGVWSPWAKLTP